MAMKPTAVDVHWNYFLSVEDDLMRLSRFIEFNELNYECFSIENTRILIAAAAETEVICRQICKQLAPTSSANNIMEFRDEIINGYPRFSQLSVSIPRYGITLLPWDSWNKPGNVPKWWTAYNKMKHERDSHYHLASLENVLNAVAGLYVASLYLHIDKVRSDTLRPRTLMLQPTVHPIGMWIG
jgi:hypothetical protein